MKKRIIVTLIAILAIIIITFLIVLGLFFHGVNYNELREDMKSIKKQQNIIHAIPVNSSNVSKKTYKGKGYIIKIQYGGEIHEYKIYIKNKEIWHYSKIYPETVR